MASRLQFLTALLLSSLTITTGAPFPSQADSSSPSSATITTASATCCFSLSDASTNKSIQQDSDSGYLYLDSAHPKGRYCITRGDTSQSLRDTLNNACFLSPDGQFKCLDPTIGPNKWGLASGDKTLTHDGGLNTYMACPAKSGGSLIWAGKKTSTAGCRSFKLKAADLQGTC